MLYGKAYNYTNPKFHSEELVILDLKGLSSVINIYSCLWFIPLFSTYYVPSVMILSIYYVPDYVLVSGGFSDKLKAPLSQNEVKC